jgi:hypothetical protein
VILLFSASWVARITGVSHQCPAQSLLIELFQDRIFRRLRHLYLARYYGKFKGLFRLLKAPWSSTALETDFQPVMCLGTLSTPVGILNFSKWHGFWFILIGRATVFLYFILLISRCSFSYILALWSQDES